ncbi:MAG: sensor domain-containing diguanylate cyclase [Burkholderiales bacterium]|nr:MAG: sensor domain-containing diguanylate cyclase [Burkholderiales bacterium]
MKTTTQSATFRERLLWRLARTLRLPVEGVAASGLAGASAREAAQRARETEARLQMYAAAFRSSSDAMVLLTPEGVITEVNPAGEQMTGARRDQLLGHQLFARAEGLNPPELFEAVWCAIRASGSWSGEVLAARLNGEQYPAWLTLNAIRGDDGRVAHLVCVARDITERKRSEAELEHRAFHDPLTGLANRALLSDRLEVALAHAERNGCQLALMYVDLDRFKAINDRWGHAAGDRVLLEIGRRIASLVRSVDTVARLGGDEFVILLAALPSQELAIGIADRLIDAVARPVDLGFDTVAIGASVGVSFFPRDGRDAISLGRNADRALYEAKSAGRGRSRVFRTDD